MADAKINKEELDYFMGFFNCWKLMRETLSKVESIYLSNYKMERRLDDIYNLVNASYKFLENLQAEMFKALEEKYGDLIEYDEEFEEYRVRPPSDSLSV